MDDVFLVAHGEQTKSSRKNVDDRVFIGAYHQPMGDLADDLVAAGPVAFPVPDQLVDALRKAKTSQPLKWFTGFPVVRRGRFNTLVVHCRRSVFGEFRRRPVTPVVKNFVSAKLAAFPLSRDDFHHKKA